jgi:hypothetical protein
MFLSFGVQALQINFTLICCLELVGEVKMLRFGNDIDDVAASVP